MRMGGIVLAILGIIVVAVGLVNHFVKNFLGSGNHWSIIVGAVGAVLLVIGIVVSMLGGRSQAA